MVAFTVPSDEEQTATRRARYQKRPDIALKGLSRRREEKKDSGYLERRLNSSD